MENANLKDKMILEKLLQIDPSAYVLESVFCFVASFFLSFHLSISIISFLSFLSFFPFFSSLSFCIISISQGRGGVGEGGREGGRGGKGGREREEERDLHGPDVRYMFGYNTIYSLHGT